MTVEDEMFDRPVDPVCPVCLMSCGVRRCRPQQEDVCCEHCPEEWLYKRLLAKRGEL